MARDQRLARLVVLCLFIIVVLSTPFTASIQLSIDPAFAKGGSRGRSVTQILSVKRTVARAEVQ